MSTDSKKCFDDIDVRIILDRLSIDLLIKMGWVDFEGCSNKMNRFGTLLGFILPLIEPMMQMKVKLLRLEKNNLTQLPSSIRWLSSLEKLFMKDNSLSTLPQAITSLRKLNHVDISNNKFDTIPQFLAHVAKVTNDTSTGKKIKRHRQSITKQPYCCELP